MRTHPRHSTHNTSLGLVTLARTANLLEPRMRSMYEPCWYGGVLSVSASKSRTDTYV